MAKVGWVSAKTARDIARVQATFNAYESASAAYKAVAGIPVVGPALAPVAAAVAFAGGMAQAKAIESGSFNHLNLQKQN